MLFVALVLSIGYTAYIVVGNIVADQSRIQQQSMSPIFSLISEEVLRPLHIAEAASLAAPFETLLGAESIDEISLIARLERLEKEFGLIFFAASERSRKQYFSNSNVILLEEGRVEWYFQALEDERDIFADLGQVGDVHLYIDIKIYNDSGEFLGIVGVGKSLQVFLSQFNAFRTSYGYDFLFVDEQGNIMLSSIKELATVGAEIPNIEDLPWHRTLHNDQLGRRLVSGDVATIGGENFLISEIQLESLDWHVVLLIPLKARQAELTRTLVVNSSLAFCLIAMMAGLVFWLLRYFSKHIEPSLGTDSLTKLPNRTTIESSYRLHAKKVPHLCVILVDIDHFKLVNDTHGHNIGDKVLQHAVKLFGQALRNEDDLLGRWGGEEFIILAPTESAEVAKSIAERARTTLRNNPIKIDDIDICVTASFGVTVGPSSTPISELIDVADRAMYQAKKLGRDRVEYGKYFPIR